MPEKIRHVERVHGELLRRKVVAIRTPTTGTHRVRFQLRGDWDGYTLTWIGAELDPESPATGNGSWFVGIQEGKGVPLPSEETPEGAADQIMSCLKDLKRGAYISY